MGGLTAQAMPLIITGPFLLQRKGGGAGTGSQGPLLRGRVLKSVLMSCQSTAALNRPPGWATTPFSHQSCATAQAEIQSPFLPQAEAGE